MKFKTEEKKKREKKRVVEQENNKSLKGRCPFKLIGAGDVIFVELNDSM